jgi:hypothetical protein
MPVHARNVSPLAQALQSSEPLARLAERLRESQRRFDCIRPALPAPLADQLRPGPVDADGWTLLAGSPAVAAKLRQLVPDIQTALDAARLASLPIRIKVLPV